MVKRSWLMLPLLALLVLVGCSLLSTSELVASPPTQDPEVYFFADDFTDDEPGAVPSNWTYGDKVSELARVEVVADDGVPSGRAMHFLTENAEGHNALYVYSPYFGELADGAKKVAVEFWYKYVQGSGIYNYIMPRGGGTSILLLLGGNELNNREKGASGNVSIFVADLEEGWNRIKLIADRESNEIEFYVNDMETPVSGDFNTLAPIDNWADMRMRVTHETHSTQIREAYYSGFKVWAVE